MKRFIAAFTASERQAEKAAISGFVNAAIAGDPEAFVAAVEAVDRRCAWRKAMAAISRRHVPDQLRARLVFFWQQNGDSLRCEVGDDLALIGGLRALLPSYSGQPKRLFRGETFFNRRRRTYGLSWTDEIEVAEHFAKFAAKMSGEGCLLETVARPEAIICSPAELSERFEVEREYLIDRRQLGRVAVLTRFKG
jgi:hypothetical protein